LRNRSRFALLLSDFLDETDHLFRDRFVENGFVKAYDPGGETRMIQNVGALPCPSPLAVHSFSVYNIYKNPAPARSEPLIVSALNELWRLRPLSGQRGFVTAVIAFAHDIKSLLPEGRRAAPDREDIA
jgi:hypothetical protein